MRTLLLFSILLIFKGAIASNDSIVKSIRKEYSKINSIIPQCRKITKDILGESTEGAVMDAYYKGNDLKLVMVHHFGETYQKITEYYFRAGEIIFVYERTFHYNRPMYYDSIAAKENGEKEYFDFAKSNLVEQRYYFSQRKMVRWIDETKRETPTGSENYSNTEKAILLYVAEINKRLAEK